VGEEAQTTGYQGKLSGWKKSIGVKGDLLSVEENVETDGDEQNGTGRFF